jgi:hypothetical protein
VQVVMDYDEMAVLFCTMDGTTSSTRRIALKVWEAERARAAQQQLESESEATNMFPGDPLMITALVISGNTESGNFTTALVCGGCSLQDLVDNQPWWALPITARAAVCQRVAACGFRALDKMHAAVRLATPAELLYSCIYCLLHCIHICSAAAAASKQCLTLA